MKAGYAEFGACTGGPPATRFVASSDSTLRLFQEGDKGRQELKRNLDLLRQLCAEADGSEAEAALAAGEAAQASMTEHLLSKMVKAGSGIRGVGQFVSLAVPFMLVATGVVRTLYHAGFSTMTSVNPAYRQLESLGCDTDCRRQALLKRCSRILGWEPKETENGLCEVYRDKMRSDVVLEGQNLYRVTGNYQAGWKLQCKLWSTCIAGAALYSSRSVSSGDWPGAEGGLSARPPAGHPSPGAPPTSSPPSLPSASCACSP